MKKHTDNLMHMMEKVSDRLTQLESRTRHLENSLDDLKVSVVNNHGSTDRKMKQLENILTEVFSKTIFFLGGLLWLPLVYKGRTIVHCVSCELKSKALYVARIFFLYENWFSLFDQCSWMFQSNELVLIKKKFNT